MSLFTIFVALIAMFLIIQAMPGDPVDIMANDLCGYISVLEKAAPTRIYDPKLNLPETEMNAIQQNYMYFGNLNDMIAKMLLEDQIYYVK